MKRQETEIRTLLVTKGNGEEFQIDIPKTWKVTFGPVCAGSNASQETRSKGNIPMALRVYESDKCQRAIFLDIISFRDMDIPIRVKKANVQEKEGYMECDGVRKRTTFQATSFDWINPDEVVDKPKLLDTPTDVELFGK